jgi:hypothetical protein
MTENSPAYGEQLDAMKPIFVPCTSGTNAFTDAMLVVYRGGIRMNGHSEMQFNRDEAYALARGIFKLLGFPGES